MKFITDENIAASVAHKIRKQGFDVKDIKEEKLYGISDKKIIDVAVKENRIIITRDKNFWNIINDANVLHKGIIFVRCRKQNPEIVSNKLLNILNSELSKKFENSLVVISESQVNMINKD
ncbi:DUF5615 family PIN-like protein [Candidatus Pacearchaeota archaeon]|nr:DUF5615 family PIN-like protein [Candidatus Pacearchaeota archaeon]